MGVLTAEYRGRLAPSPTGLLHMGHARTFWTAYRRACAQQGTLVLRNEDLDQSRCKPEFVEAMVQDLAWLGIEWQEGVGRGGPYGPYCQSERLALYRAAFDRLYQAGWLYPCTCSRQDVLRALQAPHPAEDEPVYPGTCRPPLNSTPAGGCELKQAPSALELQRAQARPALNWRFRVPEGEAISFTDGCYGPQTFVAGRDFGDFVVWRHDGSPSYQLAVVVDDAAMHITEVVRGADLLCSTARQLLIYRALDLVAPAFYHCPLVTDSAGMRLAKRHDALSLRRLRAEATDPEALRRDWEKLEESA